MINNDRIVPVTATDLISLYGLILLQNGNNSSLEALESVGAGEFEVKANSKLYLANEPVKALDIDKTASSVSASNIYFVPAYDYEGFSIDGAKVATAGVDVVADGRTLYKAAFSSNTITISKVGF